MSEYHGNSAAAVSDTTPTTYTPIDKVRMHGHVIVPNLEEGEEFPPTANDGQLLMKQGQLWNFGTMSGVTSWHPITQPKATFVHNQANAAATWQINHGLNNQFLIVTVYSNNTTDGTYRLVANPPVTFIDDNNIEIPFSDPVSGRAVLLSQGGAASSTQALVPKLDEALGGTKFTKRTMDSGNVRVTII
jgi:hypothetical protein